MSSRNSSSRTGPEVCLTAPVEATQMLRDGFQVDAKRPKHQLQILRSSGGRVHFDSACETRWRRNRNAFLPHSFEMKLDRLLDEAFHFISRIPNRDHARKVRNVGT